MATLNLQVNASGNDAYENDVGDTLTTSSAEICDAVDEFLGFRFLNVTIPNAATVNTAVLQVYITSSTTDEPDHTIYGEDVDNAGIFVEDGGGGNGISSRAPTTATVSWCSTDLGSSGGFDPECFRLE